ncbi:MAG: HAD family hydrolase [Oligoflexia bacterium]|nr:HAD family hydrolase [Oligoflexia bacterium]
MNKFDSVIFDLDGTLWDLRAQVAQARNNVVRKLGLDVPAFTAEDVQKTMGLPSSKVYQIAFSTVPEEQHKEIRAHFDTEIKSIVMSGSGYFFPDVDRVIPRLHGRLPLFLVSNCSQGYLATFLEWSGYGKYFKDMTCYGENGLPKARNISAIVQRNHLKRPVYVGDTAGDHQSATDAGVDYIHADYGFGQPLGECVRIPSFSSLESLLA